MKTFSNLFLIVWSLVACALTALSIFLWDQKIANFFANPDMFKVWRMARDITDIGLGEYYIGPIVIGLIVVQILILLKSKIRNLLVYRYHLATALIGFLVTGIILQAGKHILGRQRPHLSETNDASVFHFFSTNWDFHSFPSGHTQVLFTAAVVMSAWDHPRRFLYLGLAGFLSLTRVMVYAHFLSDVLFGSALAIVVTTLVIRFREKKRLQNPLLRFSDQ